MLTVARVRKESRRIYGACIAPALFVCAFVSACGGGGGSQSPPPPPPPPPASPQISTLAGDLQRGYADGTLAQARFPFPTGIALDGMGNLYVADAGVSTIRKVTPGGTVTTVAGSPGAPGHADGSGGAARFHFLAASSNYFPPYWDCSPDTRCPVVGLVAGLAADANGNLYIADTENHAIRKMTPTGDVTTLAGMPGVAGSADGTGAAASFNVPTGIAVDVAGNVYVGDTGNQLIRKISPAGVVTTLAGTVNVTGHGDGIGTSATFNGPTGVAVDLAGNVYVADSANDAIRRIAPDGTVTTLAGTPGVPGASDGSGTAAQFDQPGGLSTDAVGNVYAADSGNSAVRRITPAGVVTTITLSGLPNTFYFEPVATASDGAGNVYVTDMGDSSLVNISASGVESRLAGGDLYLVAKPSFNGRYVAADSHGNAYVASGISQILRIAPSGATTTISTGDCKYPLKIAVDSSDDIYILDSGLDTGTVCRLAPSGAVSVLVPNDTLVNPLAFSVDGGGNVYVIESNGTFGQPAPGSKLVKISSAGKVTAFAPGAFSGPVAIAADAAGNVYVADWGPPFLGSTVSKVTTSGAVEFLAGSGDSQGTNDGVGAAARFGYISAMAVGASGSIYVADGGNTSYGVIRKITGSGEVTTVAGQVGWYGFLSGSLPGLLYPIDGVAVSGTTLYLSAGGAIETITHIP